ncbi:MAG: efflux RND transporter periplasmic adaptor subunit [Nitrospirota bacterium]
MHSQDLYFKTRPSCFLEKENALIAPKKAVKSDENGEFLYVLNNGKKEKKRIKTGEKDDVHVEVVEGVKEGERVVIK